MSGPQILVTCVLGAVIILLYSRRISTPVVFIAAAAFLTAMGIITPAEALAGFGNDALAVMLMLITLSEIIRRTGILEWLFGRRIRPSSRYRPFLGQMMPFVAGSSAFMNNTPIVAMLIPFVGDWGKRNGVPASKLLMPLSWAAILGGMVTLVGTSTNLIVNSLVVGSGFERLSVLDFTPVGLMLLAAGMAYILLGGWKLFPDRKDPVTTLEESPREYIVEALVSDDSQLIGKTVEQAGLRNLEGLFLVEIARDGGTISPVAPEEIIYSGDELLLAGNTSAVTLLLKDDKGLSHSDHFELPRHEKLRVVECVVSPGSSLINRKIRNTDFRGIYDAAILAVHRQGGRLAGKIGEMRLQPGDLLLLVTGGDFEKRSARSDDLYVISMIHEIHNIEGRKSVIILASSFLSILLAAIGLVPLFTSLLILLALFLLTGVLSLSELRSSLNLNLLAVAAFALALGCAVQKTGLGAAFSSVVLTSFSSLGPVGMLAAVYLVTNILADFITTAAAASIVFPFAAASASALGVDATPFFLAVAYGAAANFITPVGYQTNLLIYGPGGYRFSDFLRAGLPLKLLCAVVAIGGLALVYGMF